MDECCFSYSDSHSYAPENIRARYQLATKTNYQTKEKQLQKKKSSASPSNARIKAASVDSLAPFECLDSSNQLTSM
jgi:hypothetical protein